MPTFQLYRLQEDEDDRSTRGHQDGDDRVRDPAYVVSLRPDPEDPDHVSNVRLRDGEEIRAKGAPEEIVGKLLRP